jgi:hypothetical protein
MTATARRIRTTAAVFELPQKLGILQYVEYEPPPREWCAGGGCLYEEVLTAEGCRRGSLSVLLRVGLLKGQKEVGGEGEVEEAW